MKTFSQQIRESPEVELMSFIAQTTYDSLPDDIVDHCKQSILDTMAVTIGGSGMEAIPELVDLVKEKGGKPESFIPFYGGKVPAAEAGLAIGPMARAMDFGDVHDEASHASEYIFAVLLAVCGLRNKVRGEDFIVSFAVGKEILIRIGKAFRALSGAAPVGVGDGHFIFGSMAAAGKLLDLNLEELKHAMAMVRAMAQPLNAEMYRSGTLMTRLHHGFVTQDAINACLLAQKGVKAYHKNILLGATGYFGIAQWQTHPEELTAELGERWEMVNAAMKPYSSCKCTHASIQAVMEIMAEYHLAAADIAEIIFDESTINWLTVCAPKEEKWNPHTVPECQFSLPYVVATAILGYDILPNAYTPEARERKDVRRFMNKISAREKASLPIYTAEATVIAHSGAKYSRQCLHIKGHPQNPFSMGELLTKFHQCVPYSAYELNDETVSKLEHSLLNLEKINDVVTALIIPITPI
jgi:2-methylcitrate dehydratase PrpD